MRNNFRPAAVPLVTVDPYFSVWSNSDNLMYDHTRHWTTAPNGMVGMINIDGKVWKFMGKLEPGAKLYETKADPDGMEQKSLSVSPLTTTYVFEAAGVGLTVKFTTPLLPDDLFLMSRPASYINFSVFSTDNHTHEVKIYFDVTGEWCVNTADQKVVWSGERFADIDILRMGTEEQKILNRSGDDLRIDWGYLYLAIPGGSATSFMKPYTVRMEFCGTGAMKTDNETCIPGKVSGNMPVIGTVLDFGAIGGSPENRFVLLAYDDVFSIEYFNKPLKAYWKKAGLTVQNIIVQAVSGFDKILARCAEFDEKVITAATRAGGEKYAQLLSLAYRQVIAAHKLVLDEKGEILFLSKECFSNGCIATVDVSYPSTPMFLLYNPELVEGMLRPIFEYSRKEEWVFDFAPHDIGTYPLANGQKYSHDGKKLIAACQMPLEECGNMLIMTAAVSFVRNDFQLARKNMDLLSKWADYLLQYGMDPGEQLCTDDFAGKLAHNTNLSIKAIIGIGCYALLLSQMGRKAEGSEYMQKAGEMAIKWEKMAAEEDHYKLAFDTAGSWSLKYNLVWDKLLGLNLFDDKIREKEVAYYLKKQNKYGTPLDSRRAFTKSDWLVWAASLASSKEDFVKMINPLWDFVNETSIRTPFTDFYGTLDGLQREFQHRSVLGGIFIGLLEPSLFNPLR